jgi:hypothetical protein
MEQMVIEKSDNIIFREIDGEIVIIADDGRHIHMLNETATLIWSCSNKRTSVEKIISKMCEEYDVDEDTASSDVLETIQLMAENNLIQVYPQ